MSLTMAALWGGGSVLLYGIAFARRFDAWQMHRDDRARRDLIQALALFITALAAALSTIMLATAPDLDGARGAFNALALGSFLATGAYFAIEPAGTRRKKARR